ncbi:hypothetical protein BDN72DRAFT_836438 [Pluteus cervinus]|uniref:Uncharacterized protein n=1 Tax=Pluteus cervinus TaxID=181527 RepID=A0ACD3B3A0_9AGAR|nr:hypothetical protein BDN72DRAFT_836438 [Pluteus cervinus]
MSPTSVTVQGSALSTQHSRTVDISQCPTEDPLVNLAGGWNVAGACTGLTVIFSIIATLYHCRHYDDPTQQRHLLRIIYLPMIYAVLSFFSFQYSREYIYYSSISIGEQTTSFLIVFLIVLIDTISTAASIIRMVYEERGVLHESEGFNEHFAFVYIEFAVCISMSVELLVLLFFWAMHDRKGAHGLTKLLGFELIVALNFYQTFIVAALKGRVIHSTCIADHVYSLIVCPEMLVISMVLTWLSRPEQGEPAPTRIGRPLLDSINFPLDIWGIMLAILRYCFGPSESAMPTFEIVTPDHWVVVDLPDESTAKIQSPIIRLD